MARLDADGGHGHRRPLIPNHGDQDRAALRQNQPPSPANPNASTRNQPR